MGNAIHAIIRPRGSHKFGSRSLGWGEGGRPVCSADYEKGTVPAEPQSNRHLSALLPADIADLDDLVHVRVEAGGRGRGFLHVRDR